MMKMMMMIMHVASDASHISSDNFARDGLESEEEEDEEKDDPDQFDAESGNLTAHIELERCVYISPLSPPPARAKVTPVDRSPDPWSSVDPWSARASDNTIFAEKFRSTEASVTALTGFADRCRSATAPVSAADYCGLVFAYRSCLMHERSLGRLGMSENISGLHL